MTARIVLAQSGPARAAPWRAVGRAALGQALGRLPPPAMLMLAIVSIQLASALATVLFASLGPAGTAFWSTVFSALTMTALWPPKIDRRISRHAALILAFGLADAIMALPFLLALQYIPLGIASTVGFLGPLGLAVATSRRPIHFLWIGLAAVGIALLTPVTTRDISLLGLGLAGLSALGWAAFVLISKRAGPIFEGNDGLTFGLWTSSLILLPFALREGALFHGGALALAGALAVSLLGAVLPMTLEYRALQRMSARTYGILVTLEPAVGMLIGTLCLAQPVGPRAATAVACVTFAALGVTLFERPHGR